MKQTTEISKQQINLMNISKSINAVKSKFKKVTNSTINSYSINLNQSMPENNNNSRSIGTTKNHRTE